MNTKALYNFLNQLEQNNNRDWFNSNKQEWLDLRQQWIDDIQLLINKMSLWEPRFAVLNAKDCTFRIYRDIRFKKDKSPYKTWIAAEIGLYGRNSHNGSYYVQMGPQSKLSDNFSGLYGGVWMPDKDVLKKLRRAIADNYEEFSEIINEPELCRYFPSWTGQQLKRIPRDYNEESPYAPLMKLKEFGKACACSQKFFEGDWTSRASYRFSLLKPLIDFLNYSITEEI